MRRSLAVVVSVLVVGICAALPAEEGSAPFTLSSRGDVGCDANSKAPEVIELYGDAATIVSKLEAMNLGLDKRRVYVLAVETAQGAELRLYERTRDGKSVTVKTWTGPSMGDLGPAIGDTLLKNKGVHCAGEQTIALISSKVKLGAGEVVPAPASARAAFAHSVQNAKGDFVRATVYLLC